MILVLSLSFCNIEIFPLEISSPASSEFSPPQHMVKGILHSSTAQHLTHFFFWLAQVSQSHMSTRLKKNSCSFVKAYHTFFILVPGLNLLFTDEGFLGEHKEQVAICPHGPVRGGTMAGWACGPKWRFHWSPVETFILQLPISSSQSHPPPPNDQFGSSTPEPLRKHFCCCSLGRANEMIADFFLASLCFQAFL